MNRPTEKRKRRRRRPTEVVHRVYSHRRLVGEVHALRSGTFAAISDDCRAVGVFDTREEARAALIEVAAE